MGAEAGHGLVRHHRRGLVHFWPNTALWLGTMDPNLKFYFGSAVNVAGERFAHGGSGIVMSRVAVYDIVVTN